MSFVEPLFLVGLVAAGLPVLVHLINRRKAVKRAFPPLRFLIQSQERVATGLKVRQWLMMAIRVLVLAVLVTALAKPFFLSDTGLTTSQRLPTATVFVVDTSMSMASADWWEQSQALIDSQIDELRPWDEVALVVVGAKTEAVIERLSSDHATLRTQIQNLSPGGHTANLREGIQLGSDLLAASQLPNQRVIVFTDRAQGGLGNEQPLELPHTLEFRTPERPQSPPSVAVVDATYEQEQSHQASMWRIDVTLQNFGDTEAENVDVRLLIEGKTVAASRLAIPAKSLVKHTFRHTMKLAASLAEIEIEAQDDALSLDNRFIIPIRSDLAVETLIVNGEPSSVAYTDEVFFLERALRPRKDSQSNIVPIITTREGFEGKELNAFDVVVLANVSHVSAATAKRLTRFVEQGGGLFIAAGDKIDVTSYNQNLAPLLPKPLRGLKQLAARNDPDAPVKITRFGAMRRQHPIFQAFELPGGDSLQTAAVFSYMLLEPTADNNAQIVLSFKNASPALLERRIGRGRVIFFSTTVDLDWGDLPTRTAFLPLMQRSINYLARRASSKGKDDLRVGDRVELDVGSLIKERAIITGPSNTRAVLKATEGIVSFRPIHPGTYTVWADSENDGSAHLGNLDFSVNVDVVESDLRGVPTNSIAIGDAQTPGGTAPSKKHVNLWPPLLFAVTILLLLESIIGTRRSVLTKIWRTVTGRTEPSLDEV